MPSYKKLFENEKKKTKKLLEMIFNSEIVETQMWEISIEGQGISMEDFKEDWMLSLEAFLEEDELNGEEFGEMGAP